MEGSFETSLLNKLDQIDNLEQSFSLKKSLPKSVNIKHIIKLASNCISLKEDNNIKFFCYSVKVDGYMRDDLTHYILKELKVNLKLKERFKPEFDYYEISGMGLYTLSTKKPADSITLHVVFKGGQAHIVEEKFYSDNLGDNNWYLHLFKVTFTYIPHEGAKYLELRERCLNIYFKRALRDHGYSRSNTNVYIKMLPNQNKKFIPEEIHKVREGVFFFKGYKITSFINNRDVPILRLYTRFRLIHTMTFWDVWNNECKRNTNTFNDFCAKTRGIKVYGNEEIKILKVIYAKPSEIVLRNNSQAVTLLQYLSDFIGLNMSDDYAPILVKKNMNTKKMMKNKLAANIPIEFFYHSKLVFVAGTIPGSPVVAPKKVIPLNKLYNSTLNIINDLKHSLGMDNQYNITSNFLPMTVNGYILDPPVLEFGNKQVIAAEGIIYKERLMTLELPNDFQYIIVYNIDVSHVDVHKFKEKLSNEYKCITGDKLSDPLSEIVLGFSIYNFDENTAYKQLIDKIITPLKNIDKYEKEAKRNSKIVILFIFPYKHEKFYNLIKRVFNSEKMEKQSQIISLKKCYNNNNNNVLTNIIYQMLAKFGISPWRFKPIDLDIQKRTLLITYSVGYGLVSLSYSLNSDFTKNYFIQEEFKPNSSNVCTIIDKLFKLALYEFAFRINVSRPIDNIIVYRNGLSASNLDMFNCYEMESMKCQLKNIKKKDNERLKIYENANICCIMVNSHHENLLFLEMPKEGLERDFNKYDINSIPFGLVINDTIVLKNKNEFYLASQSSNNKSSPTRYWIVYDETNLNQDFIINLTFSMTFLYYNVNKSIGVPAPLHLCHRRNTKHKKLMSIWKSRRPSISY
jgi:hypothetical protein